MCTHAHIRTHAPTHARTHTGSYYLPVPVRHVRMLLWLRSCGVDVTIVCVRGCGCVDSYCIHMLQLAETTQLLQQVSATPEAAHRCPSWLGRFCIQLSGTSSPFSINFWPSRIGGLVAHSSILAVHHFKKVLCTAVHSFSDLSTSNCSRTIL